MSSNELEMVEKPPSEAPVTPEKNDILSDIKELTESLSAEEIAKALLVKGEGEEEATKVDDDEQQPKVTENPKGTETLEDEFAYVNQGFTSEIFKIEIKNLPRHYGASNLKNLLNEKLKCKPSKIKLIKPGCKYAFACFRCEEDRDDAIQKICGYKWKGQDLLAIKSKPSPDPLLRKRNRESQGQGGGDPKKLKTLEESTTPLAHLTYEDQLKQKQSETENLLKEFGKMFWVNSSSDKRKWIEEQREKFNGLPCQLLPIKASPQINGYRNKCEFTIGKDKDGEIVVGFRLGSYADGFVEVGPLENLKHISPKMKEVAKHFENFVKNSGLKVFNNITHEGHFRNLLTRESNKSGEIMLAIGMHPQDMKDDEIKKVLNDIVDYFSVGKAKDTGVSSIYFQRLKKRAPGELWLPFEHIWGNTHITDELLGLKFRISAASFFQVNTKAAEVLYTTVAELGQLNEETVALDICCGIGTIGLCVSKKCKKVLGVEIIKEAIEDANFNATANEITNCEFTCAHSDDWIRSVVKGGSIAEGDKVVAIVDPPRAGLHDRSISQIRNCEQIKKLVYVSCSPKSVFKNFTDLCRPCTRTLNGNPFSPKLAVAVDLFPHTPHMELLVLFERDE